MLRLNTGCAALVAGIVAFCGVAFGQDARNDDIRYAEKMPLADESLVLDATPTVFGAVAVGARGHILLSDDYKQWRQAESVPTRATLTAVEFVDREGWAVGHDSVIIHTDDAGETWERQYHDPGRQQPFMDVLFLDSSRGFAVGAYDLFMTTRDGGATWTDAGGVDEEDDWHLNDIIRLADGTFLIAAEQGLIYRSTDDGRTWERINLPYQGSMFGIVEVRSNEALVFGLRGNAYVSTDSGASWESVDTGTDSSLFGGTVLQSGEVIMTGSGGAICRGDPAVARFSTRKHPDGESLAGVIQARDGDLVFYGLNGIAPAEQPGDEQ